jgi:hypothetical protein
MLLAMTAGAILSNMLLAITLGPILSEILIILGIVVVIFIILKLGNIIVGLVINSILGLLAIFAVNYLFNLGILYNLLTIIIVAITGLPGAAVIIVLKLIGIPIP